MSKDKQNNATSDRLNVDAQGVNGMENRQNPKSLNNGGFEQDLATPNTSTDDRLDNRYNNLIDMGGHAADLKLNGILGSVKDYMDNKGGNIDDFINDVEEIKKSGLDPISKLMALRRAKNNAVQAYRGKDADELHKYMVNAKMANSEDWNSMMYIDNLTAAYEGLTGIRIDPDDGIGLQIAEKVIQERKAQEMELSGMAMRNKIYEAQGTLEWKEHKLPEFQKWTETADLQLSGQLQGVERMFARGKQVTPEMLKGAAGNILSNMQQMDNLFNAYGDKAEVKQWKKNQEHKFNMLMKLAKMAESGRQFDKRFGLNVVKALNSKDITPAQASALGKLNLEVPDSAVANLTESIGSGSSADAAKAGIRILKGGQPVEGASYLALSAIQKHYDTPTQFLHLADSKDLVKYFNAMSADEREEINSEVNKQIDNLTSHAEKTASARQLPIGLKLFHQNQNGVVGVNTKWADYDLDETEKRAYTQYAVDMYATAMGALNLRAAQAGLTTQQYIQACAKKKQDIVHWFLSKVGRFY